MTNQLASESLTRAEHRLLVLTDKGAESPYLSALGSRSLGGQVTSYRKSNVPDELGIVATKIRNQIDAFGDPFS